MILKHFLVLNLLVNCGITFAFQPWLQKPTQVQVAPVQKKSIWDAAREGDLTTVMQILKKHPGWVDTRQRKQVGQGLTPLSWAVINNHLDVTKFLVEHGANVNFKDDIDQTILHMAARTGNLKMVLYLFANGAKQDINARNNKGRTPLAEVLRASKDAIIHLKIETRDLSTPEALRAELPSALSELADKESRKLSTEQMIPLINLFIANHAFDNPVDATGHTLDYYINASELVSELDRIELLKSLGVPITDRIIQYSESNLPDAIGILQKLATGLKKYETKINNVIWTIQEAKKESNQIIKYNLLRIAMGLLSNVKELIHNDKEISEDYFKKLEPDLDNIRTILRDTALLISGKIKAAQTCPVQITPTTKIQIPSDLLDAIKKSKWDLVFGQLEQSPNMIPAIINERADSTQTTILMAAASTGKIKLVKEFIKQGADLDLQNNTGTTALIAAIATRQNEIANLLLDAGANPHLVSPDFGNALNDAVFKNGNIDLIKRLLALGVNPNVTGRLRSSPLDLARRMGRKDIEKLLLDAGAK